MLFLMIVTKGGILVIPCEWHIHNLRQNPADMSMNLLQKVLNIERREKTGLRNQIGICSVFLLKLYLHASC